MQENVSEKKQGETESRNLEVLDYLKMIVVVMAAMIVCFQFFFSPMVVSGNSMYPTLHDHDIMMIRLIGYTPTRNDVVVLSEDEAFGGEVLVKRIIATAGDTVYIDYDANTITVNGETLDETYINREYDSSYGDDPMVVRYDLDPDCVNTTFVVPEHSVFVCGDNRNHSSDSRVAELGMVDEQYVIGKVLCVLYPFSDFGGVK